MISITIVTINKLTRRQRSQASLGTGHWLYMYQIFSTFSVHYSVKQLGKQVHQVKVFFHVVITTLLWIITTHSSIFLAAGNMSELCRAKTGLKIYATFLYETEYRIGSVHIFLCSIDNFCVSNSSISRWANLKKEAY